MAKSSMPSSITITIYSSSGDKTESSLPRLPCVIGRSPACDFVIADRSVSARHALLSVDAEGKLVVSDLGSTNGTVLNGHKISKSALDLPTELRFGNVATVLALANGTSLSPAAEAETDSDACCYYRRSGKEIGPFTWHQLQVLATKGVLHGRDPVWTGRDDSWLRADLVPGLLAPAEDETTEAKDDDQEKTVDSHRGKGRDLSPPLQIEMTRELTGKEIVCPHCWNRFDVADFLYIAQHHDLVGDSVLGSDAQQRFLPSRFTPERHAIDAAGLSCPDLACPRCHLRIPRVASEMPPLFASIVGATASGKSHFLTAMIWELRNTLAKSFAMALTDTDAVINQIMNDFEEELFLTSDRDELVALRKTELQGELYNQVMLDGMPTNLPKPFMFSITPAKHHPDYENVKDKISRTLVLYDNAGEHFEPGMDSVDNPTTRHILYSDTLFFVFDPTKDVRFRDRLAGKKDPQLDRGARVQRQEVLLTEMINRIEKYSGKRVRRNTDQTLMIVVSKCDIWLNLLGYDIPRHPWRWDPACKTCALDMDLIMSTSYAVRALLDDICPELVTSAEEFAGDVIFLPNSALGGSPELNANTGMLGVRPRDIRPFWVTVPMLCLFHRHGLMPVLDESLWLPRKTVDISYSVSGDFIFVNLPDQEIPLQIPLFYAGCRLRCPRTGQWFTLPAREDF